MDSIDKKISNIREAMTDADLDTAELDELEYEVQELKGKVQAKAWDILMGALPRDLDYGHALELRDHILAWNKEHNFLPTEPGL